MPLGAQSGVYTTVPVTSSSMAPWRSLWQRLAPNNERSQPDTGLKKSALGERGAELDCGSPKAAGVEHAPRSACGASPGASTGRRPRTYHRSLIP